VGMRPFCSVGKGQEEIVCGLLGGCVEGVIEKGKEIWAKCQFRGNVSKSLR